MFANRYIFSAIDPINGDSFHLIGWNDVSIKHTYKSIEEQKQLLDDAVAEWMADSERMQKLTGYSWILEQ